MWKYVVPVLIAALLAGGYGIYRWGGAGCETAHLTAEIKKLKEREAALEQANSELDITLDRAQEESAILRKEFQREREQDASCRANQDIPLHSCVKRLVN